MLRYGLETWRSPSPLQRSGRQFQDGIVSIVTIPYLAKASAGIFGPQIFRLRHLKSQIFHADFTAQTLAAITTASTAWIACAAAGIAVSLEPIPDIFPRRMSFLEQPFGGYNKARRAQAAWGPAVNIQDI
jgi:hypothetical protein